MTETTLLQSFDLLVKAPGGVARLRALILTLAVRGKLVPQDPTDEGASVVLKMLLAQREKAALGGRRKGNADAGEMRGEHLLDDLPAGWEWVSISEFLSLRKGKVPKLLNEKGVGLPLLDIEALDRGNVRRYTEDVTAPRCTDEDILVVCDGSRSGLILTGRNGVVGSTLAVIDTLRELQPYVRLIFMQGYERWNSAMKGAAIPHLDTKQVLQEVIGLPPLAEQSHIVARVEELMKLCDALEEEGRLADEQHTRLTSTLFDALANSESAHALAENWKLVAEHFDLLLDRPEAVDALEQTILQLAVRGLLVPQDPKDEPASELLKKIRMEKDRLIAEGKIKRDKPLPPIAEEDQSFALPSGWEWVRVGDVVEMLNGYAFKSEWFKPTGVRLLRNLNVSHGYLDWTQSVAISDIAAANYEQFFLRPGDVVLSLDRPIISTGLKYAVVRGSDLPCLLLQRVAKLSPDVRLVSPEFLLLWLQSDLFIGNIDPGRSNGVPHISTKQVANMTFPVPPLFEQARIVTRVESLRRLCADLHKRLTVSQSTQSRLAEALVAEVV